MKRFDAKTISDYALLSLIQEVSASPKPGLVDRFNSGSHKDMDYNTFIESSFSIKDYFGECFDLGLLSESTIEEKKKELRKLGKIAEEKMYDATYNVNTHKGIIFSLGFLTFSMGILQREKGCNYVIGDIINQVKELCSGITEELNVDKSKTYGEKLYQEYGFKGIRGEAEEGFSKSLDIGLRNFKEARKKLNVNDSLIQVLFNFMIDVEDSNVLGRGSLVELEFVQEVGKKVILLGGMYTEKGRDYINSLNDLFVSKNISPGGSADYLILTYFLSLLDDGDENDRV